MSIEYTPVQSSNISAVAKDGKDLLVKFKNGTEYRYSDAGDHYDGLIGADSVGRHFGVHIRPMYKGEKV